MGEIIYSIVVGSCLVVSGVFLIIFLKREEKMWKKERKDKNDEIN